jgi:hemerythrin-like domain-containing protein
MNSPQSSQPRIESLTGGSAAPGFDDPLEMLQACHGRIQAQCTTLHKLVNHLQTHGNDEQAAQAARAILRYFDTAGRHHHDDEEQDLFPRLLATRDQTAAALVARLLDEHKSMDAAWQRLRPQLVDIAEDRSNQIETAIAEHFTGIYAQHIALENGNLLPLASTLLQADQLRSLGQSMAARRGVKI